MFATTFLDDDRYSVAVDCCSPVRQLIFSRDGTTTSVGDTDDDARVWGYCTCTGRCRRIRRIMPAPAIPATTRALPGRVPTRQDVTEARWRHSTEPVDAWAFGLLGACSAAARQRYAEAGVVDFVDAVEWWRAGVTCPGEVRVWLRAGVIDGHDAACWRQAGGTPRTIRRSRQANGCAALQAAWPKTRPATRTCAARIHRDTAAQGGTIVALDGGHVLEIYRTHHQDRPAVAASVRDSHDEEVAAWWTYLADPATATLDRRVTAEKKELCQCA